MRAPSFPTRSPNVPGAEFGKRATSGAGRRAPVGPRCAPPHADVSRRNRIHVDLLQLKPDFCPGFGPKRRHGIDLSKRHLRFPWGNAFYAEVLTAKLRHRLAFPGERLHKFDFSGKRLHGIEFASKTAGSFFANRVYVEVFAWNFNTDRISSRKSQVAFREIEFVSTF